jgi:hypothetical protein
MPWFSAHAILYVRLKDGAQRSFPVWENIYLVEASNPEAAVAAAEARAREDEGDSNGSFTWEGRPAEWVFAGIRKLIAVSHVAAVAAPVHGAELSYSQFVVPSIEAVRKLADGQSVQVRYVE